MCPIVPLTPVGIFRFFCALLGSIGSMGDVPFRGTFQGYFITVSNLALLGSGAPTQNPSAVTRRYPLYRLYAPLYRLYGRPYTPDS